jgi:cytochrome c-type biogenesis protein CcmH/NrfF
MVRTPHTIRIKELILQGKKDEEIVNAMVKEFKNTLNWTPAGYKEYIRVMRKRLKERKVV